jgi:hypothetical protein
VVNNSQGAIDSGLCMGADVGPLVLRGKHLFQPFALSQTVMDTQASRALLVTGKCCRPLEG